MTAPNRDGRSMFERARELAKLSGHAAHEHSGELAEALRAMLFVVDAALDASRDRRHVPHLEVALDEVRRPFETIDGFPTARARRPWAEPRAKWTGG